MGYASRTRRIRIEAKLDTRTKVTHRIRIRYASVTVGKVSVTRQVRDRHTSGTRRVVHVDHTSGLRVGYASITRRLRVGSASVTRRLRDGYASGRIRRIHVGVTRRVHVGYTSGLHVGVTRRLRVGYASVTCGDSHPSTPPLLPSTSAIKQLTTSRMCVCRHPPSCRHAIPSPAHEVPPRFSPRNPFPRSRRRLQSWQPRPSYLVARVRGLEDRVAWVMHGPCTSLSRVRAGVVVGETESGWSVGRFVGRSVG